MTFIKDNIKKYLRIKYLIGSIFLIYIGFSSYFTFLLTKQKHRFEYDGNTVGIEPFGTEIILSIIANICIIISFISFLKDDTNNKWALFFVIIYCLFIFISSILVVSKKDKYINEFLRAQTTTEQTQDIPKISEVYSELLTYSTVLMTLFIILGLGFGLGIYIYHK